MSTGAENIARLAEGGLIDRSSPVSFRFNGRALSGFRGDTLASALLANGVRVVGRSFKYHRPRGVFSAGDEEPCAVLDIGEGGRRVPCCRAPMVPLSEELTATSPTGWPSLRFDLGRVLDYSRALWPAGFYNKTFMWPSWHAWEKVLRRMTGLGRVPEAMDPDHYEQVRVDCDLLVCGGGPAGLMTALTAARAGLRVVLADMQERFGGSLLWEQYRLDGGPALSWADRVVEELRQTPGVILLPSTVASGIYDHGESTLVQSGRGNTWRECLWTVHPRRIVLATGVVEQGLVFPDNDRPGVMLAGAVRHYLNRYAVVAGQKVVVATNNDSAYRTVDDLSRRGLRVRTIVDVREDLDPAIRKRVDELGIEWIGGAQIGGTRGANGVRQVGIRRHDGAPAGHRSCDLLAVSGGWSARLHLLAHARGTLRFDPARQSFVPDRIPEGMAVVGAANGTTGLGDALAEAAQSAAELAAGLGCRAERPDPPRVTPDARVSGEVAGPRFLHSGAPQFIDLAHDVTLSDAKLAVREGYSLIEHFKRYTTTGMSVDQGKTGNLNALFALSELTGRSPGDLGTTTFRPPYSPVTLGTLAGLRTGELYVPRRLLPANEVHRSLGARFEDYGWQRPDYYPLGGESTEGAIRREVLAVRQSVGLFDNSPIGKLELSGPDAAEFLNRLYVNQILSLDRGRIRYGLMLNENGAIIDDGVCARLGAESFLVNTTSGGVARIAALMEQWLQCEWRDLRVLVDDMTEQWANFTIAGPRSRDVLRALGTDIDLSVRSLPHMAAASGTVAGMPARVLRVSFSGEMSYEINVPAARGSEFMRAALDAGRPFSIAPYGVEALMALRAEKGYPHIGTDTDGSTIPDDIGWGRAASAKKTDFVGKRSLSREVCRDPDRKQLVGLEAIDQGQGIRAGGHLLAGTGRTPPALSDGWITTACLSPTLERWIGLALMKGGRRRLGEVATVCDEKSEYSVRVVSPMFYDPGNQRLRD
jgi:sarcosine oxidase subunit alpha